MTMKKKLFALSMCLILLASVFTGCGGKDDAPVLRIVDSRISEGKIVIRAAMLLLEDQTDIKQLPTMTWIIILVVCIVVVLIVGIFVGRCTKKTRATKLQTVSN